MFEARGEILTVPAEKGDVRNLTNTPGVMERDPAWSPDGKSIAYFSDESGEYMLHIRAQNGMGDVQKIALADQPAFYRDPRWSPDSTKIAYMDNHLGLWYVDVGQKKPVRVDTDYYQNMTDGACLWSPDSKWIAYTKQLKSHMSALCFYSLADGKATQVTDGMSEARNPVFDTGRQVSVLHRQHRYRREHAAGDPESHASVYTQHLSGGAGEGRGVAAGA